MSRRLRAVVGGSLIVGSVLGFGSGIAGAQAGEADLVAGTPSVSPSPAAGGTSTYSIGIANLGPDDTTGVRIQTNFNLSAGGPISLASASVTGGGSCNIAGPRVVVCNVPALANGSSVQVSITFTLPGDASGAVTVNGRLTSDLLDPDPDNFTSTGPLDITPPPTTAPPPTEPPTTAPATTTATTVPEPNVTTPAVTVPQTVPRTVPRPIVTVAPEATTPADPASLPSTGPTAGLVALAAVVLAFGGILVLIGRRPGSTG